MKKLIVLIYLISAFSAYALDDIVMMTKNTPDSMTSYVHWVRQYILERAKIDPYHHQFEKPIVFNLKRGTPSDESVSPRVGEEWWDELQRMLKINLFQSNLDLTLHKLEYHIHDFYVDVSPEGDKVEETINYVTKNTLKGFELKAEAISFDFAITKTNGQQPIKFAVKIINPLLSMDSKLESDIMMHWKSTMLPETLKIDIDKISIVDVLEKWQKNPDMITFKMEDVTVPKITIRVGNKEIIIEPEKVRDFVLKQQDKLKISLVDVLLKKFKGNLEDVTGEKPFTASLNRKNIFQTSKLEGEFVHNSVDWLDQETLMNSLTGTFCLKDKDKGCDRRIIKLSPFRLTSEADVEASETLVRSLLKDDGAEVVLSIHEHYFNRLLIALIKTKELDDVLGDELKLGPTGIFALAEDPGHYFSMYIDVIQPLSRMERIMLGRHELRFPVKLKVQLELKKLGDIPHLYINVIESVTTTEMILYGIPEYGLKSNVGNSRLFREKILGKIKKQLAEYKNKNIVDLDLPILKGTPIEKASFSLTGMEGPWEYSTFSSVFG